MNGSDGCSLLKSLPNIRFLCKFSKHISLDHKTTDAKEMHGSAERMGHSSIILLELTEWYLSSCLQIFSARITADLLDSPLIEVKYYEFTAKDLKSGYSLLQYFEDIISRKKIPLKAAKSSFVFFLLAKGLQAVITVVTHRIHVRLVGWRLVNPHDISHPLNLAMIHYGENLCFKKVVQKTNMLQKLGDRHIEVRQFD